MLLEALLVFRVHCTVVISIKNDDMLNNGFLYLMTWSRFWNLNKYKIQCLICLLLDVEAIFN